MRKVYHTLIGSTVIAASVYGAALQAQTVQDFAVDMQSRSSLLVMAPALGTEFHTVALADNAYTSGQESILSHAFTTENTGAVPPNTVPQASCKNLTLSLEEGCSVMVEASAFDDGSFDADNDPMEFSVSPEGPYPIGTTEVTFRVDDGRFSSECKAFITVEDKLDPQIVFQNLEIELDAQGNVSIDEEDVDLGSSDNCSIADRTLSKTMFSCANVGDNMVTYTVTDGSGNKAVAEVLITVLDLEAPHVENTFTFQVDENTKKDIRIGQLAAEDNCGELAYFIKSGNVNNAFTVDYLGRLKVKNTSSLDFETTPTFTLTVEVADNRDNVALTQVVVQLNDLNDNIPQVNTQIAAQEILEDVAYTFPIPAEAFTDADAFDKLTVEVLDLPAWLQLDAETTTISGTPGNEHVGTYQLRLQATDKANQVAEQIFSITVQNTNDAPVAAGVLGAQVVQEDETYSFIIPTEAFNDIDAGEVLTYSASELPNWLSLNGQTRELSGIPLNEHVGEHEVRVLVTDKAGMNAEQQFTITVLNTNDAPHMLSLTNRALDENTGANFLVGDLSTEDVDAHDSHTYTLVTGAGDADNAAFMLEGNRLSTTRNLNFEEKQEYAVRIRTTDASGAIHDQEFLLSLNNLEDATAFLPTLFSPNADGSNDRFILRAFGIEQLKFRIYNRQGHLVYQTQTVAEATEQGWDGTSNGRALPEGTYVWLLEGRFKNGSPLAVDGKSQGTILLIR